jgi:lysophospholipase L1-like esterase
VRRVLFFTGLALLLASLVANGWLGQVALRNFVATSEVRLDPIGSKFYEADRARAPAPGGVDAPLVVLFGDSRAVMWPSPWVPGYRVINRGIGNQTTAQMLLRFDVDVAPLHPTVVVIEGGVNDLKTLPEIPERRGAIVADCEANLSRIVDKCRQIGATVVLMNIIGIGHIPLWRRPLWSSEVADAVREVNAFLPRLAGEKVLHFDAGPLLTDERGDIRTEYQLDYLHLSPAGYNALDRTIVPLLSALPK